MLGNCKKLHVLPSPRVKRIIFSVKLAVTDHTVSTTQPQHSPYPLLPPSHPLLFPPSTSPSLSPFPPLTARNTLMCFWP